MRPEVSVNVDIHRIGLPGDLISEVREHLVIHDEFHVVAYGGNRIGGSVDFRFSSGILDKWDDDIRLQFLGTQLALPAGLRSEVGEKAITSILLLDTAFRAIEPSVRILGATIAVEVLLARDNLEGRQPQSFSVARRVAYLTCESKCGRSQSLCPYTRSRNGKGSPFRQLLADLESLAEQGKEWRCSAFLHIAAPTEVVELLRHPPLFTARNEVAHEGQTSLTEKEIRRLRHLTDSVVMDVLYWFAAHPDASTADLDKEIESNESDAASSS